MASDTTKTVDASLWWDPFDSLLTELENASLSSEFPKSLDKKLKDSHKWLLDTVSQFKPPNKKSREALDSSRVMIGSHELNVQPELREAALKICSLVSLDEVQSYILLKRLVERNNPEEGDIHPEILNLVMLEYYIERQCLLKCTRQILMHALYFGSQSGGSPIVEEAHRLISDGLESKLISNFQHLLTSNYPDQMDIDLYNLWAEETLIEDNLLLDIVFLAYYDSFCICDAKCWKTLCGIYEDIVTGSYNIQKLAISPEAVRSIYHAKIQLLLILIEALNLENVLQMIHDNIPFRQGSIAFSETDIQEMDTMISSFSAFEAKEAGPLILAWAVFLCLVSSLPGKEENNLLMEIDHIGYVRQAFEASSLGYFFEILQTDTLQYSDGPLAGYRSVLRTFISAFVASYEISLQFGDDNLKLILDILCKIYQGEDSLCSQFWDRDSFIDGPIRCLLCNLEGEFPYRNIELVRLLSALCEDSWPSECVFNFLDKSVGLSTPLELNSESVVDAVSKVVETRFPLHVTGVEGLVIPSESRGQVLRMINNNTALVRWEYTESGVLVLLLRLAQEMYRKNTEDIIAILDLFTRLVTFNTAVCYSLLDACSSFRDEDTRIGNREMYSRINVVEIVCALVKSVSPSMNGAIMMSLAVNILTKMLKCLPSRVASVAMKGNIFDVDYNSSSSGSWLLFGRLAKMLLIDCEEGDCSLALSVLNFTMNLLEIGLENDTLLSLMVFSLQYVLVNHEFWKYKVKHARWKVTLKVLEVLQKFISSISFYQKLGNIVRDILLRDSSVHAALFRLICTTTRSLEKHHMSRVFEVPDIEGLQRGISSGLDFVANMVSILSKDSQTIPAFHQAVLSPTTKPIPVITAAVSLISYSQNPKIQIGAARLISTLFDFSQSCTNSNTSLSLDDKQVASFRKSICNILSEQSSSNEDLIVTSLMLLTSAARNQPAFLIAVIAPKENETENASAASKEESLLNAILHYVKNSEYSFTSKTNLPLSLLNFLHALWQGAPQFTKVLERLKFSDNFWKQLTNSIKLITTEKDNFSSEKELQSVAYRFHYLSNILDILGYEMFLQKKLTHAELIVNRISKLATNGTKNIESSRIIKDQSLTSLKEIISTWCESSMFGDVIKACVSCEYDLKSHRRAKVAAALCFVRVMMKIKIGDTGSLSVSLVERIATLSQKLRQLPAFSELLIQYAERGYSQGQELDDLILSDLFYHIQGEIEGREIDYNPFKHLLQFFLDSEFLDTYKYKKEDGTYIDGVYLYDSIRLRADLGLDTWNLLSAWKETTEAAENMLICLENVNSKTLHLNSKLLALRGIITLLYLHDNNVTENESSTWLRISENLVSSCIDHTCQCINSILETLTSIHNDSELVLDILKAQTELLLLLMRSNNVTQSARVLVLKSSAYGLKVLCGCRQSLAVGISKKFLLMSILESAEVFPVDASLVEVLPVLCNCVEKNDVFTLSLTTVDFILKGFSTPDTWFLIIQKHLPLQRIIQEITSSKNVSIILKFLLNLARFRRFAEMLLNAGILSALRLLLFDFSEGCSESLPVGQTEIGFPNGSEKTEPVWGLSVAILTTMISSLEDSPSSGSAVEYVMNSILVEKAPEIMYYLSAPDIPSEKKRSRSLKSNVSISDLKETQNTLTLICLLARKSTSWNKSLKEIESQLREKSIHFLAFISRANQRLLLCRPVMKQEFEWEKKPPFINSRNGWFANICAQTHFSDVVAIEMYKIGFLILNFLSIQAENASRKAENVGFVDVASFPELPMPEILHGLQDQGMAIITELCESNKTKQVNPEIRDVCLLLFQMTVMALYLEFCVIQICGIRPVSGRIETFSKELGALIKATEGHVFLKEPSEALKQIVSFVYPELLRGHGLF